MAEALLFRDLCTEFLTSEKYMGVLGIHRGKKPVSSRFLLNGDSATPLIFIHTD